MTRCISRNVPVVSSSVSLYDSLKLIANSLSGKVATSWSTTRGQGQIVERLELAIIPR